MKKIILIAVTFIAILAMSIHFASCINLPERTSVRGSGNLVTRTMAVPEFNKISAHRAVTVIISDKITDKIAIIADDNVIDYVSVTVKNGRLTATIDNVLNINNTNVTVTVPVRDNIRELDATSAARITSNGLLISDNINLTASSAAKIDVSVKAGSCGISASSAAKIESYVEAERCNADASSAANITLKGSAAKCEIETSSAAKFSGKEFVIVNCDVKASSGSNAVVNCTGTFRATASSGASVRNVGKSTNNIVSKSSGGSVSF